MKKKYLPLYYKWVETEEMPYDGLCAAFGLSDNLFNLLTPTNLNDAVGYWGYIGELPCDEYTNAYAYKVWNEFTPLRQNIVLFLAAMNNEL